MRATTPHARALAPPPPPSSCPLAGALLTIAFALPSLVFVGPCYHHPRAALEPAQHGNTNSKLVYPRRWRCTASRARCQPPPPLLGRLRAPPAPAPPPPLPLPLPPPSALGLASNGSHAASRWPASAVIAASVAAAAATATGAPPTSPPSCCMPPPAAAVCPHPEPPQHAASAGSVPGPAKPPPAPPLPPPLPRAGATPQSASTPSPGRKNVAAAGAVTT